MRKHNLFLSLITVVAVLASIEARGAHATEQEKELPRLVVNLLIDQLRSDYMEAFAPLYGEDGLQRLMKEGRQYQHGSYPLVCPDRASATALFHTGAFPSANGIVAQRWIDRNTLQGRYCLEDQTVNGRGTTDRYSPKALETSTPGDQLKLGTGGKAYVLSVAAQADMAVWGGGHAADQVVWIDDRNGNWVSSSYYGELPLWADRRNIYQNIGKRLRAGTWQPLLGNRQVKNKLTSTIHKPFSHRLSGDWRFVTFKTTGMVNDEIAAAVTDILRSMPMGEDETPDLLSVALYAGTYANRPVEESVPELQDTYTRLDRAIATILRTAQEKVGKAHVLLILSSTGTFEAEEGDLTRYRIPHGTFDMRHAASLLNIYLASLFGKGNYIEATLGNEIFLNHKLLSEHNIDPTLVEHRAQDFLLQLSGVKEVLTAQQLLLGAWSPQLERERNGFYPKRSGDISVRLLPGWHGANTGSGESLFRTTSENIVFPIIFYGSGIVRQVIESPTTVDCVAPTVSKILRIRGPNGCQRHPLF